MNSLHLRLRIMGVGYWDFRTYELVLKIPDDYIGLGGRLEYRFQDIATGQTMGRSVVQFPVKLPE